jgi:ABC-type glutathione transport system ATPase component
MMGNQIARDRPTVRKPIVGVVGPCGAGKTTLVRSLQSFAIFPRHIAQEHSYVKDMWKRMTNPDVLVFLDASYETSTARRSLNWTMAEYEEQQFRLRDARSNADLLIPTDDLSPQEVLDRVLAFMRESWKV